MRFLPMVSLPPQWSLLVTVRMDGPYADALLRILWSAIETETVVIFGGLACAVHRPIGTPDDAQAIDFYLRPCLVPVCSSMCSANLRIRATPLPATDTTLSPVSSPARSHEVLTEGRVQNRTRKEEAEAFLLDEIELSRCPPKHPPPAPATYYEMVGWQRFHAFAQALSDLPASDLRTFERILMGGKASPRSAERIAKRLGVETIAQAALMAGLADPRVPF